MDFTKLPALTNNGDCLRKKRFRFDNVKL